MKTTVKVTIIEQGTTPPSKKVKCPACGGAGKIMPLITPVGWRDCAICSGKGWFYRVKEENPVKGIFSRFKTFLGF